MRRNEERPAASAAPAAAARPAGRPAFGNSGIYTEFKGGAGVDFAAIRSDSDPVVVPHGPIGMPANFAAAPAALPANPAAPAPARKITFGALSKGSHLLLASHQWWPWDGSAEDLGKLNTELSRVNVAEYISNEHDFENLRRVLGDDNLENFVANARANV